MADKYEWSEDHIPTIDVHSTKKHEVLREYLKQYILIVGGRPFQRQSLKITFVDAFAGGGIYEKPDGSIHDGSPLIFLEASQEATYQLSLEKQFQLYAHYFFIEKNAGAIKFLTNLLIKKGFENQIDKNIFFIHGIFDQQLTRIINHIKMRKGRARRCIFLLDQYGYKDVPLYSICKIFNQLPNAEAILTFNVDSLINYLSNSASCKKTLERIGLPFDLEKLDDIKSQKHWRSIIQHDLYKKVIKESKARYFTNFFIKSNESHRSYWLLHLSMHPTARNEMQKLHWKLKNHFSHEGKAGLSMLGYDPYVDGFDHEQDFLFTNQDEIINHNALLNEIPDILPIQEGILFENLILQQCNFTPSTFDMINNAVKELYRHEEIRILTKKGKTKRPGAKINPDDIVKRQNQMRLF